MLSARLVFYRRSFVHSRSGLVQLQAVAVTLRAAAAATAPADWGTYESRALFFVWMWSVAWWWTHCLLRHHHQSTGICCSRAMFAISLLEHWQRSLNEFDRYSVRHCLCCWWWRQPSLAEYWLEIVWLMALRWSALLLRMRPYWMMTLHSAFATYWPAELSSACHCCWWCSARFRCYRTLSHIEIVAAWNWIVLCSSARWLTASLKCLLEPVIL